MDKLKALILYFVSNFHRPLGRTELVKIIYYFEYSHYLFYGSQYTGVNFIRDNRGPFSWEIPDSVETLSGVITVQTYQTYFGSQGYKHFISDEKKAMEYIVSLPDYVIGLASEIIELFKYKTYSDFLEIVYTTPPMERIIQEEKHSGHKLLGRDVNMADKSALYKPGKARLKAAKQRLNLSSRGSDEEYNKNFYEQYKKYEDVRGRATKCLLN